MKKFLSIILAVVFIFSTATVAFAATNKCPYCETEIADETVYNAHIAGECDFKYRACQYGCGAGFSTEELLSAHEAKCPEFTADCEYCGETIVSKNAYDEHVAACKEEYNSIPADKIVDTVKGIDWEGIAGKVVSVVKSIDFAEISEQVGSVVAKVITFLKPLIVKIVEVVQNCGK